MAQNLLHNIIIPSDYPYKIEIIGDKLLALVPKNSNISAENFVISVLARNHVSEPTKVTKRLNTEWNKLYNPWLRQLPLQSMMRLDAKMDILEIDKSLPPNPVILQYITNLLSAHENRKKNKKLRRQLMREYRKQLIQQTLSNSDVGDHTTSESKLNGLNVLSDEKDICGSSTGIISICATTVTNN